MESATPASIASPFPSEVERWVALRTSARWEKHVAEALEQCHVPVYLPLMSKKAIYRSKQHTAVVPPFSGYVFCSDADFRSNNAVPRSIRARVAQILVPPNPAQLRAELIGIAEFLGSHRLIQERVYGKPGDTVRVIGGLFAGQVGVIRGLKPQERKIVLEIKFLGVRLEVDVEEHQVQKV